jgi:hypothetical protein
MRRLTKSVALSAAILAAGCMTAGCGSTVSNAIGSLPKPSISIPPLPSVSVPPRPSAGSSPTPSVTSSPSPSAPASSAGQPSATHSAPTPTLTAQPSSSPAPGSTSGSGLIWLWVLLGALVLIGLIVWIARARGRRAAAAAGWRSRIIDAYAKGSALHDAMSVAETPGALAAADAGARWSDIQRRADDLTQTLYALREAAPDDEGRARVADALASLQAVRSAMDAERAPGGAGPQQAEVIRGRLATFEASLRALRASDEHAP